MCLMSSRAPLNAGYGRPPTSYIYTSADTLLGTPDYQSPAKAAAGALLQAFAFTSGGGGGGGSYSAPASPLDTTLLYTRDASCMEEECRRQRVLPAVDLLDRMALLRRLGPTTQPAARPAQLVSQSPLRHASGASVQLTAASARQRQGQAGRGEAVPPAGPRRWAWDDSLLCGSTSFACRPIAAVPAPGWCYCGDIVSPEQQQQQQLQKEVQVSVASPAGWDDIVVVVHSPRAYRLCLADDRRGRAADTELEGSGASSRSPGRRTAPAFRPPGPLQHKFGNKPRPRSAPGSAERAERAREAGLRGCCCPHSPRAPAATHSTQGVSRQRQMPQPELETLAAVSARPRSAAPVLARGQSDSSTATKYAVQAAAPGAARQNSGSDEADVDVATTTVAGAATGGTNVVVVFSPVTTSPRCQPAVGVGRSEAALRTHQQKHEHIVPTGTAAAGHRRQGGAVPTEQPGGAVCQEGESRGSSGSPAHHTRLTVSVPAACTQSFSIRADANSPAAVAMDAAVSSSASTPIRSWQGPPLEQRGQGQQGQDQQELQDHQAERALRWR